MNHLTDEQVDDILIGDALASSFAHLDACPECAARLDAVLTPVTSFNAASLAWGQRRSATLPLQLRQTPAASLGGVRLRIAIGTASAALFALALAFPLLHHRTATETTQQAAATPQKLPSAAVLGSSTTPAVAANQAQASDSEAPDPQIARDNQLLQAIDRELTTSETPAELLRMAGQQDANQISPDVTHND